MLSRRQALKLGGAAAISAAMPAAFGATDADYALDIAPYSLQISAKHSIKTIAYDQQVPGQLLRLKEGQPVTIDGRAFFHRAIDIHRQEESMPVDDLLGASMVGHEVSYDFTKVVSGGIEYYADDGEVGNSWIKHPDIE